MKRIILVLVVLIVGLASGVAIARSPLYEMRPIAVFPEDAVKCAADGGKGALVADLDESGDLASEWETYCLLESK